VFLDLTFGIKIISRINLNVKHYSSKIFLCLLVKYTVAQINLKMWFTSIFIYSAYVISFLIGLGVHLPVCMYIYIYIYIYIKV
jgi:hypothetical protein